MVQDLRWCLWAGREDSSARGWRGQAQRSMCKPGEKEEVRSTGGGGRKKGKSDNRQTSLGGWPPPRQGHWGLLSISESLGVHLLSQTLLTHPLN